jgi:hypothetical protein
MQDTRSHRSEQEELTEDEVERLSRLLVPDPSLFSGDRNRRRTLPNLFVETVKFDEHGEEKIGQTAPRGVDATTALPAHFRAGRLRTPATLPNYNGPPIRAVSLGYEDDDLVGWFSLDLDGDYPIESIGPVLAQVFGKRRLVCHSGSGRKGRYRVFGLIASSMTVRRLKALMGAVCAHLGFPPVDGALEIYPAYKHSRLPGGLGGCQIFDLTTGKPIGKPSQARLVRTMLDLEPIDLEAIAKELGIDASGIDTAIPRSRGRFDPRTRRERRRSIPRYLRAITSRGVTRPGERQKVQRAFVLRCMLEGLSADEAIPKFYDYIDEGKFDASFDVQRNGREWLKKQVPRIVLGIYASTRPIGMPDPIALDGAELHRVRKIAIRVHAEHPEFSARKVEGFLKKMLAIFKGCLAAGLPLARIHSKIWQAAGGTHYKTLRNACGIFKQESGYKSMKLVLSLAHLGAKPCEAKAIDWSTSFVFDRDLPAPSYEIARSILVEATPLPPVSDPIVVASFPSTPLPRKASPVRSRLPKGFTRLYVHHLQDPLEMKGSENLPKISILPPDEPIAIDQPIDIDYERIHRLLSDEIGGAKRRREEIRRKRREALFGLSLPKKVPEWRRIAKWALPGAEGMDLDEWLARDAEIKREYEREKREAIADRKTLEREHGIYTSIGKVASKRFHELRKLFGLDPWN